MKSIYYNSIRRGKTTYYRAYFFALSEHLGQYYSDKKPYFYGHVCDVEARVIEQGGGLAHRIVAILHDVVEDTPVTLEIIEEKFGSYIMNAVDAISRRKGVETHKEYILRVMENPLAHFVKICDVESNMAASLSPECSPDKKGLVKRYEKALEVLGKTDDLWGF